MEELGGTDVGLVGLLYLTLQGTWQPGCGSIDEADHVGNRHPLISHWNVTALANGNSISSSVHQTMLLGETYKLYSDLVPLHENLSTSVATITKGRLLCLQPGRFFQSSPNHPAYLGIYVVKHGNGGPLQFFRDSF